MDESAVTTELTESAVGCELLLIHELEPKWVDFVDRANQSWTMMIDRLAESLTQPL